MSHDDDTDPGRRRSRVVTAHIVTRDDGTTEITGHPDAVDDARRALEEGERRARVRRQLWGDDGRQMERLCALFPSLRGVSGTDPWDVDALLTWLSGPAPTSGSTQAALFVLGVWNPGTDWKEVAEERLERRRCNGCDGYGRVDEEGDPSPAGPRRCSACDGKGTYQPTVPSRFDVYRAIGCWDAAHVAAFLKWCEYPFWP
jgi:hypothetical protein